jgi:hypothetical protein
MNDAPDKIWAWRSDDVGAGGWTVFDDFAATSKTEYIRYDKHRGYMADMRAAFYGSCDQIGEYREQRETDKARIEELEAALTTMIHSFDNRLIDMDDARDLAYFALGDKA